MCFKCGCPDENGAKDVFEKNNIKQEKTKSTETITQKRGISTNKGSYYYHGKLLGNKAIREILEKNASPEIYQNFNKGYKITKKGTVLYAIGFPLLIIGELAYLETG